MTEVNGDITTITHIFSYIKEFESDDDLYSLFAGINYAFFNGFVLGGEISFTSNDQRDKSYNNGDGHIYQNLVKNDNKNHQHNHINSNAKLLNESLAFLIKGKYLIDFGSSIYPFIGGGIGVSRMELSFHDGNHRFSDLDKIEFAYMGTSRYCI